MSFRTVRKNTIRVAEDIPEDKYDFRATPDTRTVAQMLAHIAVASRGAYESHAVERIQTYVGVDFAAFVKRREEQASELASKPQILEALRDSGESWARFLDGVTEPVLAERVTFPPEVTPPSKTRFEMFLSVKEQEMHARAQVMLIERWSRPCSESCPISPASAKPERPSPARRRGTAKEAKEARRRPPEPETRSAPGSGFFRLWPKEVFWWGRGSRRRRGGFRRRVAWLAYLSVGRL